MTRLRLLLLTLVVGSIASGCAIARRQHVLIDRYTAAVCLALSSEPSASTREWNAAVQSGSGRELRIIGHERVSGVVVARDDRTGQEHMVANAGDSIYPADIRTSPDFGRVFVKADGLAGGFWRETWLYECDLVKLRKVARIRVDPSILPPECPATRPNQ